MRYGFKHSNYNKFSVYEENKLRGRAYFVPFSSMARLEETDYFTERYNSDRVRVLNGEWDFKYFAKLSYMPREIDTEDYDFDKVTVPSCWQFTGYEEPFYVNARYQFKVNPPYIPEDAPVAIYRKTLTIDKINEQEILSFLGVCAALELYINGHYVGYSEGSHNTAEFDVTKYLAEGNNEIVALVYKFCNGSYVEAQDMFRNNGIFRDVLLISGRESMLYDFHIFAVKKDGKYTVSLTTDVKGVASAVRVTVKYKNDIINTFECASDEELKFIVDNPREWSAEIPELYHLYIELVKDGETYECVRAEFGLRDIKINGNVFLFNGQNIKLKGVNHHDTNESNGFVMSPEELRKDVEIMKEYNCNAVRTSHYPPDPLFIKLCNYYGLYVVDEADIEAHGVAAGKQYRPNLISNNEEWRYHYWDRVRRMYERDKNNPCVTMWSLGNEAGGWRNQVYCYNELKKLTDREPIHYEGMIRTPLFAFDVISRMYASADFCHQLAEGKIKSKREYSKPFFQCEYAHAMGVGPGDLDYYVDAFYKADNLMGGCIWEFADHAVKHANDKYKYEYTYGGDHGEFIHDGNFCVDGLFYPDRTPNSGALCMKNVYRPIRAKYLGGDNYELTNTNRFLSSDDVKIEYILLVDGEEAARGDIAEVIAPKEHKVINIKTPVYKDRDVYMTFNYYKDGRKIAFEQVKINDAVKPLEKLTKAKMFDNAARIGFDYSGGSVSFDKQTGAMLSYNYLRGEFVNQKPYRKDGYQGFAGEIYRAAIDNYMSIDKRWVKHGFKDAKLYFVGLDANKEEGYIDFIYRIIIKNKGAIEYVARYTAYENGAIDISVRFKNNMMFVPYDMPKMGMNIELPSEYSEYAFYGYGDEECYSDFNKQSVMGVYCGNIDNMFNNYIKPQDNGNRMNVKWLTITNKEGNGLMFIADNAAFNFSACRYTLDNLKDAKHREDLEKIDAVSLNIDGFVRGIGSNSCGPDTRERFRYILKHGREYSYSFRVQPVAKG